VTACVGAVQIVRTQTLST